MSELDSVESSKFNDGDPIILFGGGTSKPATDGSRFNDAGLPIINLGGTPSKKNVLAELDQQITKNIDEIRGLQHNEFAKKTSYRKAWETATHLYQQKLKSGKLKADGNPEEYHIALIAYTLASPKLYQEFNLATRSLLHEHDFNAYPFKTLFSLLNLAVQHVKGEPETLTSSAKVYRGCQGELSNAKKGQHVIFQHFLSTSAKEDIAQAFGSNVVFVISGGSKSKYVRMDAHSAMIKNEHEVLFSPLELYEITSVKKSGDINLIDLKIVTKH
ncbi:hypothetical protein HA402_005579 [Bradysia odoriphaga]|nr:hypothetical protein HA402_005579 [Bradysia odoriphaga]